MMTQTLNDHWMILGSQRILTNFLTVMNPLTPLPPLRPLPLPILPPPLRPLGAIYTTV